MKETDLFKPIRTYLANLGYDVQGEILASDCFAVKDSHIVIVELKLQVSLKLIYQALERQKVATKVYIATPFLVAKKHIKNNPQFSMLLKRLNIGLIGVKSFEVEVLVDCFDQEVPKTRSTQAKKRVMLKEFNSRDQHLTLGGTNEKKMTFYREQVLEIAKALYELKEADYKMLKAWTRIEKTATILRSNFDGWFQKNEKGLYMLSPLGQKEVEKYLF